jgi:hypothetical protein
LKFVPASDPWHFKLAVEEIEEWFSRGEGHHASWRRSALRRTLDRLKKNGSASTEDAARFSLALSQYLRRLYAPSLAHNPGKDRSGPIIKFPGSSEKKTLWWKVATNQMTLQLMNEYQGLAEEIDLPPEVEIERAADHGRKCDYLVATTEIVDFSEPFEDQISIVESAMEVARRILSVLPRLEALVAKR